MQHIFAERSEQFDFSRISHVIRMTYDITVHVGVLVHIFHIQTAREGSFRHLIFLL